MNHELINGYIVDVPLGEKKIKYRGPSRNPWDDLGPRTYGESELPQSIRELYRLKRKHSLGYAWVVSPDKETAVELMRFLQSEGKKCKLLALYSPWLYFPSIRISELPQATFLGYDVVPVSDWSLVREMQEPVLIRNDLKDLFNENGLLSDPTHAKLIETVYRELAAENILEPIAEPNSIIPVECIPIFSIQI